MEDEPQGLGVKIGNEFVSAAECKRRIEAARKKGPYGSCWICGKEFPSADYECKHTFD